MFHETMLFSSGTNVYYKIVSINRYTCPWPNLEMFKLSTFSKYHSSILRYEPDYIVLRLSHLGDYKLYPADLGFKNRILQIALLYNNN